jgi:hypothetical protein
LDRLKELRFTLPLIPIYLIGVSALFADDKQYSSKIMPGIELYLPYVRRFAVIVPLSLVTWLVIMGGATGIGRSFIKHKVLLTMRHYYLRQAYLMLSRLSDVKGVIDDSGVAWVDTGGYYEFHQSAPIYRSDLPMTMINRVRQSPQLFASHWVTSEDVVRAPTGYELMARSGSFVIWRRSTDSAETLMPAGYSTNAPYPPNLTAYTKKVAPRW